MGGSKIPYDEMEIVIDAALVAAPEPTSKVVLGVLKAMKLIDWVMSLTSADPLATAIAQIRAEIAELRVAIDALRDRVNALSRDVVKLHNEALVEKLRGLAQRMDLLAFRLSLETVTPNDRAVAAFEAGQIADRFLDPSLDLWAWMYVKGRLKLDQWGEPLPRRAADGTVVAERDYDFDPATFPFYTALTLPLYVRALKLLSTAVLLDTQGNPADLRVRHLAVMQRHMDACRCRDGWDKVRDGAASLAERVRSTIIRELSPADHGPVFGPRGAADGRWCRYVGSVRTVNSIPGLLYRDHLNLAADDVNPRAFCPNPPDNWLADAETAFEDGVGGEALDFLGDVLSYQIGTGYVVIPSRFAGDAPPIGFFANGSAAVPPRVTLYAVRPDGTVDWFRQEGAAPGQEPKSWTVARGLPLPWAVYVRMLSAGAGFDSGYFYGLHPSGELHWFSHKGWFTGQGGAEGPVKVGVGWGDFLHLVPGSEAVLYAVRRDDGVLLRYRHSGLLDSGGVNTWTVDTFGNGWDRFSRVFSVGEGTLYGVAKDGTLWWTRDPSFRRFWDAARPLAPIPEPKMVGAGWADFRDVFGSAGGVVLAQRADGELRRYTHLGWADGGDVTTWIDHGATAVDLSGYRQVLATMPLQDRLPR